MIAHMCVLSYFQTSSRVRRYKHDDLKMPSFTRLAFGFYASELPVKKKPALGKCRHLYVSDCPLGWEIRSSMCVSPHKSFEKEDHMIQCCIDAVNEVD